MKPKEVIGVILFIFAQVFLLGLYLTLTRSVWNANKDLHVFAPFFGFWLPYLLFITFAASAWKDIESLQIFLGWWTLIAAFLQAGVLILVLAFLTNAVEPPWNGATGFWASIGLVLGFGLPTIANLWIGFIFIHHKDDRFDLTP